MVLFSPATRCPTLPPSGIVPPCDLSRVQTHPWGPPYPPDRDPSGGLGSSLLESNRSPDVLSTFRCRLGGRTRTKVSTPFTPSPSAPVVESGRGPRRVGPDRPLGPGPLVLAASRTLVPRWFCRAAPRSLSRLVVIGADTRGSWKTLSRPPLGQLSTHSSPSFTWLSVSVGTSCARSRVRVVILRRPRTMPHRRIGLTNAERKETSHPGPKPSEKRPRSVSRNEIKIYEFHECPVHRGGNVPTR